MKASIVLSAIFMCLNLFSQNRPLCLSAEHLNNTLAGNPALRESFNRQRHQLHQYQNASGKEGRALVTVPVVVHVVHDGDTIGGDENISEAQILSQIDALNRDYRNQNPLLPTIPTVFRNLAADFEIEFCLAQRDPSGNPTDGIHRVKASRNNWNVTQAEQFKPSTIWNRNHYLNIWVMRLGGTDAGTLGYAQFPGLADSTDGIVIDYKAFGTTGNVHPTYNNGKTTTHEVGHWLGLYHIWGDGDDCTMDDGVADTPLQGMENYGCPTFPRISCSNGPNGDMFMNYMDYSDDGCTGIFTAGQKAVADITFGIARASIVSSLGCTPTTANQRDMAIARLVFPTAQICTDVIQPVIEVRNHGSDIITSMLINYQIDGGTLNQYSWSGYLTSYSYEHIFLPQQTLTSGNHAFSVYLSAPNGGVDQFPGNEDVAISFDVTGTGAGSALPVDLNFDDGTIPSTWEVLNQDNDRTWTFDSTGANGTAQAVFMDNYSGTASVNTRGRRDALVSGEYDFTGANIPYITFSYAYARRTAASKDSLIIYYSLDCGFSWTKLWVKGGSGLATADDVLAAFTPEPGDWREEIAWVNVLSGQKKVKFKFENYSDYGNNIYLDEFKVSLTPAGIDGLSRGGGITLSVYPNPNNGNFHLSVEQPRPADLRIEIYNAGGGLIQKHLISNSTVWNGNASLSHLPGGLYVVRVVSEHGSRVQKVLINK